MKHVYQMAALLVIVLLIIAAAIVPAIAQSPTSTPTATRPPTQITVTPTRTVTVTRTSTVQPVCIPAVSAGSVIPLTATPTTFKFNTLAVTFTYYPTGTQFLSFPTPTVTTAPMIQSSRIEILFPVAVRLEADLNIGKKDIKSATLHISQPEAKIDVKQDLDLEQNLIFISDSAALLSYPWQFDPTSAPPLFGTVDYDWTVQANDGTTATLSGKFQFHDDFTSSADWCMSETGSVRLYSQTPGLDLNWAQHDLAVVQDRVVTDTGVKHSLNAVMYSSDVTFCAPDDTHPGQFIIKSKQVNLTLPCTPDSVAKLYQAQGYALLKPTTVSTALRDELTGAIVADAYDTYWKTNTVTVPAWFRGGLIHLYDVWPHLDYLGAVLTASQNKQLLSQSDLNSPPTDQNAALWNAESYTLVLYLNTKYGAKATTELAASLTSSGPKFEDALSKITGGNIDSLFRAWQDWLLTNDAQAAAGVTFYMAPTSSPVPTDTVEPGTAATPAGTAAATSPAS